MALSSLSPAPRPTVRTETARGKPPVKLLLVDFRSGECVRDHPDVAPLLRDGWFIRSAVPRIVEDEGTRLFVVLTRREQAAAGSLRLVRPPSDSQATT